jgi:hypothetical protein
MLTNRHELFYQASRITELADHRSFCEFADRLSTDAAMYRASFMQQSLGLVAVHALSRTSVETANGDAAC